MQNIVTFNTTCHFVLKINAAMMLM